MPCGAKRNGQEACANSLDDYAGTIYFFKNFKMNHALSLKICTKNYDSLRKYDFNNEYFEAWKSSMIEATPDGECLYENSSTNCNR